MNMEGRKEMSYWKILGAWLFLLISAIPSMAQTGRDSRLAGIGAPSAMDTGIELNVKDSMGRAIRGAVVAPEDNAMQYSTDSDGVARIPRANSMQATRIMNIRAPGYESLRVALIPDSRSRLEIILREHKPMAPGSGLTVSVQDLRNPGKQELLNLQTQAEQALHHKNYDSAEKLYLQAVKLASSNATIPNNLGILALRHGDMIAASSWFEMATKIDPYRAEYGVNLGIIRWLQNRREESYKLLKMALDRGYKSGACDYIVGIVSLDKGLNEDAAEYLDHVPGGSFPYRDLFLSMALRNLGKVKSADKLYRSFLRRNPFPFAFMPMSTNQPDGNANLWLATR
jgi:Tfp pilus assembly protein PilF